MLNQEITATDTAQLVAQARKAYEQKRIRDCMALLKALLQADPENVDAKALQSAIQADVQRDLNDARGLLEQSGSNDEVKRYRKAAEIILLKTLYMDPENEGAKALLQIARNLTGMPAPRPASPPPPAPAPPLPSPPPAAQSLPPTPPPAEPISNVSAPAPKPVPVETPTPWANSSWTTETPSPTPPPAQSTTSSSSPSPLHSSSLLHTPASHVASSNAANSSYSDSSSEDIPFTVAPTLFEQQEKKKSGLKVPYALIAIVVVIGSLLLFWQSRPSNPKALAARPAHTEPSKVDNPVRPPAAQNAVPPSPQIPPPVVPPTPAPAQPVKAASTPPPADTPPAKPAPPETGKLAVSSPTVAEIYQGDKYLGSTPTTLQLPVGRQRLEYRHGDLRTVVNHDIKANETTTAAVTFQITVEINARPWAQVSLDGTPRRSLGQTPLSGVTVPIGSVLVFENPGFTSKSYRITDKDAAIQVNFP
jgi:hypothetical protein